MARPSAAVARLVLVGVLGLAALGVLYARPDAARGVTAVLEALISASAQDAPAPAPAPALAPVVVADGGTP